MSALAELGILDPPVDPGPACCITVPGEFGPMILLDPPAPESAPCCITLPAPRDRAPLTSDEGSSTQLKKLTPGDIKKLEDKGYDAEELKRFVAGRDLYKDQNGWIYVMQKGGTGEPEELGINVHRLWGF